MDFSSDGGTMLENLSNLDEKRLYPQSSNQHSGRKIWTSEMKWRFQKVPI